MITCPNCGKELEDGSRFCDDCGTQVFETIFCPDCGEQTSTEFPFCPQCGAALREKTVEKKSSFSLNDLMKNKAAFFGVLGVVAVVAVVFIVSLAAGGGSKGGSKANYTLYIKDGEIYYTNFSKDPLEITSRFNNKKSVSNSGMSSLADNVGPYVVLCSDGKTIFYPDRWDSSTFSLYYRNIAKTSEEPTRVDTNISSYYVTDKGDQVFYLKESTLYQNDLKGKNRIASNVCNFAISADGKKVLYRDNDSNLYIWSGANEKKKIASDVNSVSKYNDDLSVIYYIKDGSLYKSEKGENRKIASDIDALLRVYDSGEVYYIKMGEEEIKLMDYVVDDRPDAADTIRDRLESMTIHHTVYTLYYYDGSRSTKVSDSLVNSFEYFSAAECAVLAVPTYDQSEIGKIRLSEADSVYDVQDKVYSALYSSSVYSLVVGGHAASFEQDEIYSFTISDDGSTVVYIDDVSSDYSCGDLYQITIKGDKAGKPLLYDTDVSTSTCGFLSNGSLFYFKDVKNSKGDLYVGKACVDYEVYCYGISYYEDIKTLFYYVDYSSDRSNGILKMYKGGSSTRIADDVRDFVVVNGDDVLYLYDFSTRSYTGTMYLYNGRESKKIDDDVSGIIRIYDAETRRNYFGR